LEDAGFMAYTRMIVHGGFEAVQCAYY
jgi:hypothetical protein